MAACNKSSCRMRAGCHAADRGQAGGQAEGSRPARAQAGGGGRSHRRREPRGGRRRRRRRPAPPSPPRAPPPAVEAGGPAMRVDKEQSRRREVGGEQAGELRRVGHATGAGPPFAPPFPSSSIAPAGPCPSLTPGPALPALLQPGPLSPARPWAARAPSGRRARAAWWTDSPVPRYGCGPGSPACWRSSCWTLQGGGGARQGQGASRQAG